MNAKFSPSVQKELKKIQQKDRKLANRIEKQIALFEENPKHPSLHTHKLSGTMDNMWSISITMSIRMVYILLDQSSVIFVTYSLKLAHMMRYMESKCTMFPPSR